MPAQPQSMTLFAKASGERLQRKGASQGWDIACVGEVVRDIRNLHQCMGELGIRGVTFVSGGGNVARGDELTAQGFSPELGDAVGRAGLILNAIVVAHSLEKADVPVRRVIADTMAFADPLTGSWDPCTPKVMHTAHEAGEVVVVAGGSGKAGQTTDAAVLDHAMAYRGAYDNETVRVLKGTKFNGVYLSDPNKMTPDELAATEPIPRIDASIMASSPALRGAVDAACLDRIIESGLEMQVYDASTYTLEEAVTTNAGTLIVPPSHDNLMPSMV